MKVVLLGSTGHISRPLTENLVRQKVDTTVITRSEKNADTIQSLGAKAAIGSVDDIEFLTSTFKGATTVVLLVPVPFNTPDLISEMTNQCMIMCDAILKAGVKHVVYVSAIGADTPNLGFLHGHYLNEKIIEKKLANLDSVSSVRPSAFYTNIFGFIKTIISNDRIFSTYDSETLHSYVHPIDISDVCADLIFNPSDKKFNAVHVESERITPAELTRVISEAIKKPDLKWVTVLDPDAMIAEGFSENTAKLFADTFAPENIPKIYQGLFNGPTIVGKHKITDFVNNDFVEVYKAFL